MINGRRPGAVSVSVRYENNERYPCICIITERESLGFYTGVQARHQDSQSHDIYIL